MTYAFIEAEKANFPIEFMCRTLGVARSGFYEWRTAQTQPCARRVEDIMLTERICQIHAASRGTYGSPRVHAELRLGDGTRIGRKRVERLMRHAGLQGVHRRRRAGLTRRDPGATPSDDLVGRRFDPDGPDQLYVHDITEHPTGDGKVYLAVVLDAWSRRVIGWAIADHMRAELVVDALQMAIWRRQPTGSTVHHSDHGSQYTSWAFGQRLRAAGLLGSMGTIGDCYDNAVAESFFGTLQLELLDRQRWDSRQQLASAIFEWIEAFYNPVRRHSYCDYLSPADYESIYWPTPTETAA